MAAGASLARRAVLEQLSNMAREAAYALGRVSKTLGEGRVAEAHKAAFEAEETINSMYYRLLDYVAAGRYELLDNANLYLSIARLIQRAVQRLEASTFRLALIGDGKVPEEAVKRTYSLAVKAKEAAGILDSTLNLIAASPAEGANAVSMRIKRVAELEEEADTEYRSVLTWLLASNDLPAPLALLLKDAVDYMESVVDDLHEAANHLRIVAETY